jgi:plastocyanin
MRLPHLALAALALPLLGLAAACSDDEEANPEADQTVEPQTVDVELTMEDFSFSPGSIEINFGDELLIEIANDGEADHTFTVSEFLVDETLSSGEDRDITFTPNEPGEFTYFCRFHQDEMQGSLFVLADGATPEADAEPTPDSDDEGGGAGIGY